MIFLYLGGELQGFIPPAYGVVHMRERLDHIVDVVQVYLKFIIIVINKLVRHNVCLECYRWQRRISLRARITLDSSTQSREDSIHYEQEKYFFQVEI